MCPPLFDLKVHSIGIDYLFCYFHMFHIYIYIYVVLILSHISNTWLSIDNICVIFGGRVS